MYNILKNPLYQSAVHKIPTLSPSYLNYRCSQYTYIYIYINTCLIQQLKVSNSRYQ